MIDLERLLRIPFVETDAGFDVTPSGAQLAFSWNITGRWEIYEMDLRVSETPRRVSFGPGAKVAPRYSPDGSRLACAVDLDGSENFHIVLLDLPTPQLAAPGGGSLDLTAGIDFALQPNFCFSPDGGQIAFLADKTGCFGTYVMPAGGGEASLLLENGLPAWDVDWSPNGRHLAVMCEGSGLDFFVFVIPLDGGECFPIANPSGPVNAHDPAWSPDGRRIAFHSDLPNGFHQIGIFDMSTKEISWLTSGDANCHSPRWSKDGSWLTYVRGRGASDRIVVHAIGGAAREFQVETGVHYRPKVTPNNTSVVFVFNNPRHPPDLWKLAPDSGELRQLTHSMPAEIQDVSFVLPEEIVYPGLDGTPIPALLFRSAGADADSPAVVAIHGGPSWHFQAEWHPLMTHLASAGCTVLAPNYRGSTGYGRVWQYASRFDLGGVDADDVAAGARFLGDAGLADPRRIAVTGQSHGGYLTMSCLTRYPNLWCAGSAVVPFLNWFTGHEHSREDLQHWDIQNLGDPVENHDLWYERSPYFFLDRVTAPVQMICGENDPRCPASESIQARDRLRELGRDVDFVLYEGEGHSFRKTENVVDAELRRVKFLKEALS
jgi:dipeptidyl aminopeptidase/acylaminoacyl peptidase